MNLAWYLLTQYGEDKQITDILDTTKVWIFAVTNPDGMHWDQRNNPGSWRRTRAPVGTNNQGVMQFGVDLNRNYAYDWGSNNGSSGTPGNDMYRGTHPFSEAETQALRHVYTNNQIMTSVSGHTWGELIQYSWSFTAERPHPYLEDLGRRMADINMYADQTNFDLYIANGGHCDYVYGTHGTMGFLYEHGSFGFIRPFMGETNYGLYGAYAPYNDFYGNPRRMPLAYPTANQVAAAGAPAQDITAEVVFITAPYIPGPTVGQSSNNATVAMVNAVANQLEGKILMSHRGSSNANTAAVARAAQNAGAVGVIMIQNTTGDQNQFNVPNMGTTGDALLVNIPVAGTTRMMAREFYEHVQKGGKNELTIKSQPEPELNGGSIYYHWKKQAGALLLAIEGASEYSSYLRGEVTDCAGELLPEAVLNLSIDVNARVRASNSNVMPEGTYVDTRRSTMDVVDGKFNWSVTPTNQPHFTNAGYAVTAGAPGKYDVTKNAVHVMDYKVVVDNLNFALPKAIEVDYDKTTFKGNIMTVFFSTFKADGAKGFDESMGEVTFTADGVPANVTALGGGDFSAAFKVVDARVATNFAIAFEGGMTAYENSIAVSVPTVIASIGAKPTAHFQDTIAYELALKEAVNVLGVEVEFVVEGAMLAGAGFEALNGFMDIEPVNWTDNGDGTWTGAVVFGAPGDGFTAEGPTNIAKFLFSSTGLLGEANLTITKLAVTGLDTAGKVVYYNVIIEIGDAVTLIYNKYDINKDGYVDLIDLGIMLMYVGLKNTDEAWGVSRVNDSKGLPVFAKDCDVNGDGEVNMADLVELLVNFGLDI